MSLAERLIVRLFMSRGCSSRSGDRCTRLWLSRRSQGPFLLGVYPPLHANSRSCRCSRVRPACGNIRRLRKDNARLRCIRHPLSHVLSRALDRQAVYVPVVASLGRVTGVPGCGYQAFARGVSLRRVSAIMRDQQIMKTLLGRGTIMPDKGVPTFFCVYS